MTHKTAEQGILEADTFSPEDDTLTVEEMDAVCGELLASSQAYQQGKTPMRETRFIQGNPYTHWRFVDGLAADLYTIVITRRRTVSLFTATVSELPGCSATGITQDQALENVRQEVDLWIDAAVSEGREIPMPVERLTRLVTEQ